MRRRHKRSCVPLAVSATAKCHRGGGAYFLLGLMPKHQLIWKENKDLCMYSPRGPVWMSQASLPKALFKQTAALPSRGSGFIHSFHLKKKKKLAYSFPVWSSWLMWQYFIHSLPQNVGIPPSNFPGKSAKAQGSMISATKLLGLLPSRASAGDLWQPSP